MPRRLIRLCAFTVALVLIAFFAVTVPARSLEQPTAAVRAASASSALVSSLEPRAVYTGPTSDSHAALERALTKIGNDTRFYAALARQTRRPAMPPKPVTRYVDPDPVEASPVTHDTGTIGALICSIFVDTCAKAIRVGGCESGLDPTARNRSGASGLFQIMLPMHKAKFEAHGWDWRTDWSDPFKNTTIAFEMSGGGVSWGPWSESRHCWA